MNKTAVLYAFASAALFGASTPAAKLLLGAGAEPQRRSMAAAIAAGGVVGPLLLMWGLSRTDASAASLLLALEGAATALIAWFAFQESFDHRIFVGMVCLVAGAIILSGSGIPSLQNINGPLAIVGACAAWGLDNNLTRKVFHADPLQIVELKGLIAGPVNVGIGILIGATLSASPILLLAGIIGFLVMALASRCT
jgi:drug/metabolite transporter (DMT)-like permease